MAGLHIVDELRVDADVFQDSEAALVEALHFGAEDGPVDICEAACLDGREHVEDVHFAVHDEGAESSLDLVVHENAIVGSQG